MDFGSDKFGQIRVRQKRTKGDSVGQKRTDEDSGQDRTISVRQVLLAGQDQLMEELTLNKMSVTCHLVQLYTVVSTSNFRSPVT